MWEHVIEQERVVETLRRAVAQGRVAHAYLFHGPDGSGKKAAALALAAALLCERNTGTPCGKCLACTKVRRLIHPDIHVFLPHPKDADDLTERVQLLAENPYAEVDFTRRPNLADPTATSNKQAMFSVEMVNEEIKRTMGYRPHEGRFKLALMPDADLMRTEAANAFLKLLEEPGPQTVFVLTTNRPDRLLPTILSRCQRLRFDRLSSEGIEKALVERENVEPERAATLARMADGSYTRALELSQNEAFMADRALVLDFFRQAYKLHASTTTELIEQMAAKGREQLKGMLNLMLLWVRDLLHARTLGPQAILINPDQADAVQRFIANLPDADLEAAVAMIEEAVELIERNVQNRLVLTTLAFRLHRAMRGPTHGRLYEPLAEAEVVS